MAENLTVKSAKSVSKLEVNSTLSFTDGIKAGLPIAIGYIPIAITFGLVAKGAGIPNIISILMSLVIFAGASQFIGVQLITLGVTPWEIIMTTFILNLRHFLMSASLVQKLPHGTPKKILGLLSFGITDESFTVASLRKEEQLSPSFVLGLNIVGYCAWNLGTMIGVFMATGLPSSIQLSMGIAFYAMFIGLIVPSIRDSQPVLVICLIAGSINAGLSLLPFFSFLSSGWCIIITTLITATIGTIIYPKGVKGQ